jgi:hypothetical protein
MILQRNNFTKISYYNVRNYNVIIFSLKKEKKGKEGKKNVIRTGERGKVRGEGKKSIS